MKRVSLLTGGGGIFGSAFCRAAREQFDIAAVCRRRRPDVPSQLQWFRDPLEPDRDPPENRDRIFVIDADLTKPGEIDRVVDMALARFGRIDLVINAARDWKLTNATQPDTIAASLEAEFNYNVIIPARLAATVLQKFWRDRDVENRKERRNVINMSSISGLHIYPNVGQAAYSASKAAENYLTRHMSNEYAPYGVRVNALAPNTFPAIVSTNAVIEAALRMDREDHNGRVLSIDKSGEKFY
jgi:NAD(P)-dependent dehydrogenase (short-subunit alcohol dehydrogenase family)